MFSLSAVSFVARRHPRSSVQRKRVAVTMLLLGMTIELKTLLLT
jgi:hypothetical protein